MNELTIAGQAITAWGVAVLTAGLFLPTRIGQGVKLGIASSGAAGILIGAVLVSAGG